MFYIYLKTHSATGLKYLGFTSKDPFKYKGSGKYWRRHLRKHGSSHLTEILFESEDMDSISDFGKKKSIELDIVSSEEFANLKLETGNSSYEEQYTRSFNHSQETIKKISENNSRYWKGKTGKDHHAYGRPRPDSVEIAKNMAASNRGKPSWNSGRTDLPAHSEETKDKMSLAKKGKAQPKVECPHCKKVGGASPMSRFHFDNCRKKI